jgi:ArsR family transcriptional regulator, arsenate/arsenite/antimonite-responsive transcriptional repressor
MTMETPFVVAALGALAHEHRLAIYRLLVERGPTGLSAGAIGERVGLLPSSLTFHLQNLQRAGLITQQRSSRQLIYSAEYGAMSGLISYLTENCDSKRGGEWATACKPTANKVRNRSRKIADRRGNTRAE